MKQTDQSYLYLRGTRYWMRRRIPAAIRAAYPPHTREVMRSLNTSDPNTAKKRLRRALVELDTEFARRATKVRRSGVQRVSRIADRQLRDLAQLWVQATLETDDTRRAAGLDEEELAALGERIQQQLATFGPMLARGNVGPVLPALYSYLHLCGLHAQLSTVDEQNAGYVFLQAVVKGLEAQARRHSGQVVETDNVTRTAEILVAGRRYSTRGGGNQSSARRKQLSLPVLRGGSWNDSRGPTMCYGQSTSRPSS